MDPIAAFKQQQKNNFGTCEKSDAQMREVYPRWSTIFDRIDTSGDGALQLDEVIRGFRQILGSDSTVEVPLRNIQKTFAEFDTEGTNNLDFRQFVKLAQKTSGHMMDNPRWLEKEQAEDAKDEKLRLAQDKARKEKEGPDIFAALGLRKSADIQEAEIRKKRALEHASSARQARMASIGSAILRSGSQTGVAMEHSSASSRPSSGRRPSGPSAINPAMVALGARRFAGGLKRSQPSIESNYSVASEDKEEPPESPTKKLRDAWDRFSISSAHGCTRRTLGNTRQIHLPDLPQIRALGKKSAGCFSLRFSPDGSQVAGGFFDGGVRIFDVDKASQVHCMNLPKFKGGSVKGPEDKARERTDSDGGDLSNLQDDFMKGDLDADEIANLMKKWEPVTNLRWQPATAGKLSVLATIDTKGSLSLWDVPRNREMRHSQLLGQVEAGQGDPLSALAWSCDGVSIAVAGRDRVIKLFDVGERMGNATGNFTASTRLGESIAFCGRCVGHSLKIISLGAHPTQPKVIISAGMDANILLWDIRSGVTPVHQIHGPELASDAMNISRDGHTVFVGSHRSSNPLEVYDLRMNEEAKPTASYAWRGNEESSEGGGKWTTCLLTTACWDDYENKTIVAAGENENLARVYERSADAGEPLRIIGTMRGKGQAFSSSAISTDGGSVALGSSDGAVCLMSVGRK